MEAAGADPIRARQSADERLALGWRFASGALDHSGDPRMRVEGPESFLEAGIVDVHRSMAVSIRQASR